MPPALLSYRKLLSIFDLQELSLDLSDGISCFDSIGLYRAAQQTVVK
jgi:hypothetical protein